MILFFYMPLNRLVKSKTQPKLQASLNNVVTYRWMICSSKLSFFFCLFYLRYHTNFRILIRLWVNKSFVNLVDQVGNDPK